MAVRLHKQPKTGFRKFFAKQIGRVSEAFEKIAMNFTKLFAKRI